MIHFFRASSWKLDSLVSRWYQVVLHFAPLYRECGRAVLVGDGVKQAKEGRFMPGVKKLFQESENSSKLEYIFGHMFGGLRILVGSLSKWFCIPLRFNIQDGLQQTAEWEDSPVALSTHVVQMVENGFHAAQNFGNSILLLDRYFLSVPALKKLAQLNCGSTVHMELVTKAKKSCCAYEKPAARKPGPGRPPKKGNTVKLQELFASCCGQFQEADAGIYGKKEHVRYFCINLLWGQKYIRNCGSSLWSIAKYRVSSSAQTLHWIRLRSSVFTATGFRSNALSVSSSSSLADSVTAFGQKPCQS